MSLSKDGKETVELRAILDFALSLNYTGEYPGIRWKEVE
jgi:hypothetical protein